MNHKAEDHGEKHSVYIKVGVIFLSVLAALVFLGLIN